MENGAAVEVNGAPVEVSETVAEVNDAGEPEESVTDVAPDSPLPQDIIMISGKQEDAEGARDALQALVPITREMDIPFEFHRFIIGQKG